ncbi:hypothetical protein cand_015860 [Cryptosporidium andersoni]|uniref:Phospholipase/carboxylesterase/thioesterase domain-containing protein n=1 Tax=Cryptosporidium andersoni TaxID=117008 RepID=A0A1J4MVV9_9CRYT|nr:hypothetical protein cand_015860 [Cryptosporidium andersoni]
MADIKYPLVNLNYFWFSLLILITYVQNYQCFKISKNIYKDITVEDYDYLKERCNINPEGLGILGHFKSAKSPKYTILFLHAYANPRSLLVRLSKKFFVRMGRHISHYDLDFSNDMQFIAIDWLPLFSPIYNKLGNNVMNTLISGNTPINLYLKIIISVTAFINNLYRRGIINSLELTGIYGNCVGGIIALGITFSIMKPLAVTVVNGATVFLPNILFTKLFRKSNTSTRILLIHGQNDKVITPIYAENTYYTLLNWNVNVEILRVEGDHISVMIKHLYTGFRYIASVLLDRPEIYRPDDTYNEELMKLTKQSIKREDIIFIVPPKKLDGDTFKIRN